MIEYFKYKKQLEKLNKTLDGFAFAFEEASKKTDGSHYTERDMLLSNIGQEYAETQLEIKFLHTQYYRKKASALDIPMPKEKEYYEDCYGQTDIRVLTDEGVRIVRKIIREEKKHTREKIGFWFSVVTGVLGAIIGVLSAYKNI